MRYIDPETTLRGRVEDVGQVGWDAAVICFRNLEGSQTVVSRLGALPVRHKWLWGMEPSEDSPPVFECKVGALTVGVLSRCNWGGPRAAILVEELAELGVPAVVGVGAAGGLVAEFPRGTQAVASRALVTDGTSPHYTTEDSASPDSGLLNLARAVATRAGVLTRDGCVATVDAVYRETPELIGGYRARGAQSVNMETTPFYAAAAKCGIRALWLGHVSDSLSEDAWEPWDDLEDMTAVTAAWAAGVLASLAG
jgi:uridine phosphorylase